MLHEEVRAVQVEHYQPGERGARLCFRDRGDRAPWRPTGFALLAGGSALIPAFCPCAITNTRPGLARRGVDLDESDLRFCIATSEHDGGAHVSPAEPPLDHRNRR
jgi:hypothetical protein